MPHSLMTTVTSAVGDTTTTLYCAQRTLYSNAQGEFSYDENTPNDSELPGPYPFECDDLFEVDRVVDLAVKNSPTLMRNAPFPAMHVVARTTAEFVGVEITLAGAHGIKTGQLTISYMLILDVPESYKLRGGVDRDVEPSAVVPGTIVYRIVNLLVAATVERIAALPHHPALINIRDPRLGATFSKSLAALLSYGIIASTLQRAAKKDEPVRGPQSDLPTSFAELFT